MTTALKEKPMTNRVEINARVISADHPHILSKEALAFVGALTGEFRPRLDDLLRARRERQARFDLGDRPDFIAKTQAVRAASWTVAQLPRDLWQRKVEITGPVDRKM